MAAVMALQHQWFPPDVINIANELNFKGDIFSFLYHDKGENIFRNA